MRALQLPCKEERDRIYNQDLRRQQDVQYQNREQTCMTIATLIHASVILGHKIVHLSNELETNIRATPSLLKDVKAWVESHYGYFLVEHVEHGYLYVEIKDEVDD